MKNLEIYEASREVPKEAQKPFDNGSFKGTDINPMWRIKKLTELFGACGIGWYYEVVSERSEVVGDIVMAIVDLKLYIKVDGEWSKPIYGTGGNKLLFQTKNGAMASDEGYKMALTDALSVACKALGIGADIYFEADRTKYTSETYAEKIGGTAVEKAEHKENTHPVTFTPADICVGYTCEQCGKQIQEKKSKNRTWTPEETASYTKKRTGKAICFDCFNSQKEQQ